ncbi:sialic acid-binding Ig-like lectin 14 [Xyrauchen texanus]|uniref:sialic acid-binding Ig-like lectin 14 n=1 Tax=Xyrauchen texanus TaxID=154827 RepID=UPI002241B353|nr:sialic acid-binding Ig-like lectin 14 [Xyrauchen texanus]
MVVQVVVLLYWLHVMCALVLADVWKAQLEPNMDAVVSSCVVLPCTFKYPGQHQPSARMRGIWHKENKKTEFIYHEDSLKILDDFKSRTKLVGNMDKLNCSLEIDAVKSHDNGPFCFRVELERDDKDKFSFVDNCVSVKLIGKNEDILKPKLHYKQSVEEGVPAVYKCYVSHTCPSHHPTLTWNHTEKNVLVSYKYMTHGTWEVESILTITPKKEDDHSAITCTVRYHGGLEASTTVSIFVKEQVTLNHILIPSITGLGVSVLFAGMCFFVVKRYKKRIQELQSRNDNGMWSRLSRMSRRFRSGRNSGEQVRRDQRKNKVCNMPGKEPFSKPRIPSPKSQPKSYSGHDYDDEYNKSADLNIYGNV